MARTLVEYLASPGGEQDELTEGIANVIQTATSTPKEVLSAALQSSLGTLTKTIADSTYTLLAGDNGYLLRFSGACTVTVPTGLQDNFSCGWLQGGAGQITFSASGTTVLNADGFVKSEKQYCLGGISALGSEEFVLYGRLGT